MPKTVASLALVFELLDSSRAAIGETAVRRALGWADYLRSHAGRLYAAGETMAENGAKLIVERQQHPLAPYAKFFAPKLRRTTA